MLLSEGQHEHYKLSAFYIFRGSLRLQFRLARADVDVGRLQRADTVAEFIILSCQATRGLPHKRLTDGK